MTAIKIEKSWRRSFQELSDLKEGDIFIIDEYTDSVYLVLPDINNTIERVGCYKFSSKTYHDIREDTEVRLIKRATLTLDN